MITLQLDKQKCLRNIEEMAHKAELQRISFRPHCKTHQSAEIGNWFRDFGVSGITVSSLRMASYFALAGWSDILVAFPFNPLEFNVLDQISEKCKVSILMDNTDTLFFLKELNHRVDYYIDIDTGYGRTGVRSEDFQSVDQLIRKSRTNRNLRFAGFYCHAGHSYKTTSRKERQVIHQKATGDLIKLKEQFSEYAPVVLYGDTPNCSTQNDFNGIDEITPGNFVFYDLIQRSIGSCTTDEIAVALACPVVGKYDHKKKILVHGGAVHFSKETLDINGKTVFGEIASPTAKGWKEADQTTCLTSISQEHGLLEECGELFNQTKIGDTVHILPPHSCLTANLMRYYRTADGETITTLNS